MMRKLVVALAVVGITVGIGFLRGHSGVDGPVLVGGLRVVSANAQTTPAGPMTSDEAVAIVTAKLTELEPSVSWSTLAATPALNTTLVPGMTQITDPSTGTTLYQRPWPINAWVVTIREGSTFGFGLVSDSVNTPLNCHGNNCDPPGTLLAAQAFVQGPATPVVTPLPLPTCPPTKCGA